VTRVVLSPARSFRNDCNRSIAATSEIDPPEPSQPASTSSGNSAITRQTSGPGSGMATNNPSACSHATGSRRGRHQSSLTSASRNFSAKAVPSKAMPASLRVLL